MKIIKYYALDDSNNCIAVSYNDEADCRLQVLLYCTENHIDVGTVDIKQKTIITDDFLTV